MIRSAVPSDDFRRTREKSLTVATGTDSAENQHKKHISISENVRLVLETDFASSEELTSMASFSAPGPSMKVTGGALEMSLDDVVKMQKSGAFLDLLPRSLNLFIAHQDTFLPLPALS
jgi:hypothetical protein